MSPQVAAVVYHRPGCPFALRLRSQLTVHRVPHIATRFRQDPVAAARVRDLNDGNEVSPSVLVGEWWLTNPSWREVARAVARASLTLA